MTSTRERIPMVIIVNKINGKCVVFGFSREQAGLDDSLYPYVVLFNGAVRPKYAHLYNLCEGGIMPR
ncbi:MAG: hypothetical protein M0Z75_15455 [Nitrospiraceae bacterium]|nr:hypothetical protein [Nitrospiraceae bacterium]